MEVLRNDSFKLIYTNERSNPTARNVAKES